MNNTTRENSNQKSGSSTSYGSDKGLQEKIMNQIQELGDSIERAGEKVEQSGWETIGQAIYKLGNKLEHLNDKSGVKSDKSLGSSKPYTDKEFDEKSKNFSDSKASAGKVGGNDSQAY